MRTFLKFRHLLLLALLFAVPAISFAQVSVGVAIHIGPPVLPVYEQPPCPTEGYLWTPGYWAYGPAGYFWVPGAWVAPPQPGLLWTPGYWGFVNGGYFWHRGYWGPHVGYYGGVNYGFGYGGVGFWGGRWEGQRFMYNTAVVHVNETVVRNVYVDRTVVRNTTIVNNHYSFNGPGGVRAMPTAEERGYMHEQHLQPTSNQYSHERMASQDHGNWASENHGSPSHPEGMGVNARQLRQQDRIAQGVHSGQMTPHETAHVEHQEAGIHHEVHQDRAANGGHLTPQEHAQVEHQQNHVSHEIHQDKHNDRTDEKAEHR